MKMVRWMFSVLLVVFVGACSGKENVDLVNGISPRMDMASLDARGEATFDSIAKLLPERRQAYLREAWPNLGNDVTAWMAKQGRLNETVDSVIFTFGSARGVEAEDETGFRHVGYYTDELVANIYAGGSREAKQVLVRCLNGTYMLLDGVRDMRRIGPSSVATRFTIGRGQGLVHHVSYPTAMMLAEQHGLQLFRGRKQVSARGITTSQARALEDSTDVVQVTVRVYEGDQFDLGAGTYIPAHRLASR